MKLTKVENNDTRVQSDNRKMQKLIHYLDSCPIGRIHDIEPLESLLAECWGEFAGSNDKRMTGGKLYGRMQEVDWDPPVLSFIIERHGGTVNGSTRAERQRWDLDILERTAYWTTAGYTQLYPRQPRLNVEPIAHDISRLIVGYKSDERLKWHKDGRVRVLIGKILPERSAVKQTLNGRRRRLRKAITRYLDVAGWKCVRYNVYDPPAQNTEENTQGQIKQN